MATAALLLLIITLGAIVLRVVRTPEPDVKVDDTPRESIGNAAFRAGFLPLLERAAAEAQVLVAMGEDRERNLIRIRRHQEEMLERLAAADAWLGANTPSRPSNPP